MTPFRLPLAQDNGPHGLGRGIIDADGRQVAFVACHTASLARSPDDGQHIAVAIVRAVNTHAQLIDALHAWEQYRASGWEPALGRKAEQMGREALAAAEAPQ